MAPDRSLDEVLARLQARGDLTPEQVQTITAEMRDEPPRTSAPAPRRNVIPEILGYVGAALVLSAGLSLVMQRWEEWSAVTHLWIGAGAAAILWIAAMALTFASGGRSLLGRPSRGTTRRVVGVLVTAAIPMVAVAAVSVIDLMRPQWNADWEAIIIASTAFTFATVGAWWVRGALLTVAVAISGFLLGSFALDMVSVHSANWIAPAVVVLVGAGWIWLAPRLLAVPVLSEALGFAWLIIGLVPVAMESVRGSESPYDMPPPSDVVIAAWVARGLLVTIAVIAMTGFARGREWPWAAGGVIAGVFAALSIGQGALGWIAGLFIAGVVLLALSGLMIMVRTRREGHMRSGAATPQSSSPLNST